MTEPIYRTADKPWSLADNRGNHRVTVRAEAASQYVKAEIFWRRRDQNPERCASICRRDTRPHGRRCLRTEIMTARVATVGLSRWHNYYLEGLSWLMRKTGADGIYLDGVGYDRQIMKRVRKVLDESKEGCLIDFHSGNNFHPDYGLCNVLSQYMELLPSVDSLWIGEGFDYENTSPDYWLAEISGIPFGLMGDMLHRGGNKWRGMVFGMTPRCNWPEGGSPLPVWQLWDSFGMTGCTVRGWWDENCPVTLSDPDCRATAYVAENRMLISIASWAEQTVQVQTFIRIPEEWGGQYRCVLPEIEGFQNAQEFASGDSLTIEPNRGKIIVINKMGE